MYIPDPNHHDEDHTGIYNLLFTMKILRDCRHCGATYDNGGEEDAIQEAWERAKRRDPAFRGLTLKRIRAEVAGIQSRFGGHNNCWGWS